MTLIVLYRIAAEARGLAAHELPLAERAALRDRALPVMLPGYQAPAGTERAEDPVEIVALRSCMADDESARDAYLAAKLEAARRWRDDRIAYADAKTEVIVRLMQRAES